MKFHQRALLSITRRKKSTAALLLIFSILLATIMTGLSLLRGISDAQTNLRRTFASGFHVRTNFLLAREYSSIVEQEGAPADARAVLSTYDCPILDDEILAKIAAHDGIINHTGTAELRFRCDELERIWAWRYAMMHEPDYEKLYGDEPQKMEHHAASLHSPSFYVYYDTALAEQFRKGQFRLIEGRHITPNDVHAILISDELAELNGLSIGDTIDTYYDPAVLNNWYPIYDGFEATFEIVGIFHVDAQQIIGDWTSEDEIGGNYIFCDKNTFVEYKAYAGLSSYYYWDSMFFVDDPAHIDEIIANIQADESIPWDFFTLEIDESEYLSAAEPLHTMTTIVAIAMVLIICVMLVLLYLVLQMSVQGRGKELKVYHVLGIPRREVMAQFILECALIAALAFIPATTVTAVSANGIGNTMLALSQEPEEERHALTDAEVQAAYLNGTMFDLLEKQSELYMEESAAEAELTVSLSPLVAAATLPLILLTAAGFLIYQLRYQMAVSVPSYRPTPFTFSAPWHVEPSKLSHRAALYVTRERGKSLRLGLTLLVLATFLLACGAVQTSTQNQLTEVRKIISASFRLDNADDQVLDDMMIEQVMSLGNLRAYDGENVMNLCSDTVQPIPGHFAGDEANEEPASLMRFTAHHNSELAQDFSCGYLALAEGRHIAPEDESCAVISTDLAAQNGLSIGDTINAHYSPSVVEAFPELAGESFPFTIVGLFEITEDGQADKDLAESEMRENAVYIDARSGHALNYRDPTGSKYRYGVTFWVDDPKGLSALTEQVAELFDSSRVTMTVNDKAYLDSVVPLEQISLLMQILFVALSIASTCILSLILYLWTKQRMYEIGIYLSLGIPKREIKRQFLLESLSIGAAACLAAVPTAVACVKLANRLLTELTLPSVLAFCGVFLLVLAVAALATVIASRPLLRMHPRQIFAELS